MKATRELRPRDKRNDSTAGDESQTDSLDVLLLPAGL